MHMCRLFANYSYLKTDMCKFESLRCDEGRA